MIKADISKFRDFISDLEPPVTVIIGADMLEYLYQLKERGKVEEMASLLSNLMTAIREAGNVGVFGIIPGLALSGMLTHMSEVCINVRVLNKSVILYCNRPDTKLHCLENIITEDSLRINLTAFV